MSQWCALRRVFVLFYYVIKKFIGKTRNSTYVVLPSDLMMLGIGANFALEVDIVVLLDVIGVQCITQLQLDIRWN